MVTLSEYDHNEVVTLSMQVLEVLDTDSPKRACEMKVQTISSEPVRFVVWEKSPAASTDWVVDEWYHVQDLIIKQWDTYTELNATRQTIAKNVDNTSLIGTARDEIGEQRKISSENSPTEQAVEPNNLSELYESFRGLSVAIEAIIESPSSDVSIEDISHPTVQYYSVIQAILGNDNYLPDDVEGLGEQQLYRVPFEMRELRSQYGDGQWLTEYHSIETVDLSEETQSMIDESTLGQEASQFVRPVTPETETPLPVLPSSEEELSEALSLLSQFEAQPSVPWDYNNSGKLPIQEIYDLLCTAEDIIGVQTRNLEERENSGESSAETNEETSTVDKKSPIDRCKFVWPQKEGQSDQHTASCCYRKTWGQHDRCIWHADTEGNKPIEELSKAREAEENRLHNHLPREILSGAVLRNIKFFDEIFTGVDFSGADLQECDFGKVYLGYADFKHATIQDVDFTDATISKADFRNADLYNIKFNDMSLFEVDFTGSKITNSNFTDAKVDQAIFTNAIVKNTEGVTVEHTQIKPDFCIHLSTDTTIEEVDNLLPPDLPSESEVIYEIIGEKTDHSIPKKEIQNIVDKHVKMSRGYDRRTEIKNSTDTAVQPISERKEDQPTTDAETPESNSSNPNENNVVEELLATVKKWLK